MGNVKDIKSKAVQIELDKTRNLKFDLNAFAELEEIYGDMQTVFDELKKGKINAIRNLLWSGLIHEDYSLSVREVGAMIDIKNIDMLVEKISEAINEALPQGTEEEKKA